MKDSLFARIIRHYIVVALNCSGAPTDGDTHAELEEAMIDLEHRIREIVRDELERSKS